MLNVQLIDTKHSPVRFHTFCQKCSGTDTVGAPVHFAMKTTISCSPFFSWLEGIHKHCMTKNHKHWYWISIQYIVIRYIYIFLRSPPKNPTVSLVSPPASSRRTKPWRSWKIPRCTNNKNRNSRSKNSNNGVVYWLILMYYIILPWL